MSIQSTLKRIEERLDMIDGDLDKVLKRLVESSKEGIDGFFDE